MHPYADFLNFKKTKQINMLYYFGTLASVNWVCTGAEPGPISYHFSNRTPHAMQPSACLELQRSAVRAAALRDRTVEQTLP